MTLTTDQARLAVSAVRDSQGFEPTSDLFWDVEQAAIEEGYIFRKPGDQYGITAKGREVLR